jgi:hypothetical protein
MIKPGITGWAQVNGGERLAAADKNILDEWYVRHASFWLDVKILFVTIGVLFHRNAEHHPLDTKAINRPPTIPPPADHSASSSSGG